MGIEKINEPPLIRRVQPAHRSENDLNGKKDNHDENQKDDRKRPSHKDKGKIIDIKI